MAIISVTDGDVNQSLCEPCGRKNETKQTTTECKRCSTQLCQVCFELHESLKNCPNDASKDTQESLKRKRDNESAKTDIKQDEQDNKKSKISGDTTIITQQSKRHSGLPCKRCRDEDKTQEATFYCTDCEIPLCSECSDIHKTNNKTKHHSISNDVISCILMSEKRRNDGEQSKAIEVIPMEIESDACTITSNVISLCLLFLY
ncbi:uncharacterized protein LOC134699907 [Mytilus trossulus]|uniref:uncharacterized protein LOC134699907 n=1 Tax=Mytilus trossulus TaxID=6551 RepID=UPI0030055B77